MALKVEHAFGGFLAAGKMPHIFSCVLQASYAYNVFLGVTSGTPGAFNECSPKLSSYYAVSLVR
ncbi:MAG: hypothetical protein ACRD4O_02115, partial [Bryobacteraceae bacterium]